MPPDINDSPWNHPAMGDYTTFQDMADAGEGIGAGFTGTPYDVYRIGPGSNGDVIQTPNRVFQNYPVDRDRLKNSNVAFETSVAQESFFYELAADFANLKVGDVFYSTDQVYGPGATQVSYPTVQYNGFALVIHPALRDPIGARLDRNVEIWRPAMDADTDGYYDTTIHRALPLRIVNGVAVFGVHEDTPALIPSGFMAVKRTKGLVYPPVVDQPPKSQWAVYVIPLPAAPGNPDASNFSFREGDFLRTEEKDVYRVVNPYRQDTGISGYQLTVERYVSQPGGT